MASAMVFHFSLSPSLWQFLFLACWRTPNSAHQSSHTWVLTKASPSHSAFAHFFSPSLSIEISTEMQLTHTGAAEGPSHSTAEGQLQPCAALDGAALHLPCQWPPCWRHGPAARAPPPGNPFGLQRAEGSTQAPAVQGASLARVSRAGAEEVVEGKVCAWSWDTRPRA